MHKCIDLIKEYSIPEKLTAPLLNAMKEKSLFMYYISPLVMSGQMKYSYRSYNKYL